MKKPCRERWGLTVAFLVFISTMAIQNRGIIKDSVRSWKSGEVTFSEFVDGIENSYLSEFSLKDSFINLNGLFARLVGKRTDNGVVLLNNGMLTFEEVEPAQTDNQADRVKELSNCLKEKGIPFLYVQAPYKVDINNEMVPKGVQNCTNDNLDQFVDALNQNGVETLDLRNWISLDQKQINQYFYVTDHHWNSEGAFVGFQKIAAYIQNVFPQISIDDKVLEKASWTQHKLSNWFLGTHGKRVGSYFAGTDDLIWYTPNFKTESSCAIPIGKVIYKGDFVDANIRMEYTDGQDYFHSNPYLIYIGGDYGLVQHRSMSARANLKLLMIKDSYMLPVQAYLSTVFEEIDVIDLRHYTEGTLMQYIENTNPDMVIMMYSDSSLGNSEMFEFGVTERSLQSLQEETIIQKEKEIVIETFEDKDNCRIINDDLQGNTRYTITFDSVEFLAGTSDGISLVVFDGKRDEVMRSVILDIGYYEKQGKLEWTFITPEENIEDMDIRIYAGIRGHAENKSVRIKNLVLYRK